jgi:hypothetical protein
MPNFLLYGRIFTKIVYFLCVEAQIVFVVEQIFNLLIFAVIVPQKMIIKVIHSQFWDHSLAKSVKYFF